MAGREQPIATAWAMEPAALTPLPAHPVEISDVREVVVRTTGRVRCETNGYAVPTRSAGACVTLRADPFQVRLYAGPELVATHPRRYAREQVVEDFRHDVPLLREQPFPSPRPYARRWRPGNGRRRGRPSARSSWRAAPKAASRMATASARACCICA
jgi:hypothetical protein